MDEPDKPHRLICPVDQCRTMLLAPDDLICINDFTLLASTCRGKSRLGQPVADMVAARDGGRAYQCRLCRQWHTGTVRPVSRDVLLETIVRALRAEPRCGPRGLLSLADAWDPTRVKRESWRLDLDQRQAYAVP